VKGGLTLESGTLNIFDVDVEARRFAAHSTGHSQVHRAPCLVND